MLLSTDATVPAALLPSLSRYHSLQVTCTVLLDICTSIGLQSTVMCCLNACFDNNVMPRKGLHYKQDITDRVERRDNFFCIPGIGMCRVLPLTLNKGCRGLRLFLILFLLLDLLGCWAGVPSCIPDLLRLCWGWLAVPDWPGLLRSP